MHVDYIPPKTYMIPFSKAAACNDRAEGGAPPAPPWEVSTTDQPLLALPEGEQG